MTTTTVTTAAVKLPGKVLDLLDDTGWGSADNESPESHTTRAAIEHADRRRCGKGWVLTIEVDVDHAVDAANYWDSRALAEAEGAKDTFADVRYGGPDALRWARAAQADARTARTVADRFYAAAKSLGAVDDQPAPAPAKPKPQQYRWQCPLGHRCNNDGCAWPPTVCPSCGWHSVDDDGEWGDLVSCTVGGERVHPQFFADTYSGPPLD